MSRDGCLVVLNATSTVTAALVSLMAQRPSVFGSVTMKASLKMARRLDKPNATGGNTDHGEEVARLRERAKSKERYDQLVYLLAADLLESHDQSGIALDNWGPARDLVELLIGDEIIESGI